MDYQKEKMHFKLSNEHASRGWWGHHPRRAALVGVPTNRRQFDPKEIEAVFLATIP